MASTAQVTQLYQEILGRAPDQAGLNFYRGWGDINKVRQDMLGSAEYKTRLAAASKPASSPSQPLFDFAAQQKQQQEALLARQKAEQQGLFNQYSSKLQGQEQLPALYQRLQNEAGVPELSQQAQGFKDEIYRVKGLLDRLDEDTTSRTQGTYTTEAMRNRILASEGDTLRTSLSRLGTGLEPISEMLTSAQSNVGNLLNLSVQQQAKEMQPLEMQINALSDRFAREISGFNTDRENQLTAVLDKLQRERELSDRDWELAQKLAAEERDFQRQKQLATMSLGNYLPTSTNSGTAPAANTSSTRQLPQVAALALGSGNATGSILQPTRTNLQGSSGLSLQGGSGLLQGSGIRLQ